MTDFLKIGVHVADFLRESVDRLPAVCGIRRAHRGPPSQEIQAMRMTPLDIQSHQFASRLRGFDRDEVMAFLRIVSEDYESLVRANEGQAERILRLETRVEELSAQEQLLQETLVSAQAMTEEMSRAAEREAELRLAEAEVRAEKILDASHRRAARLEQDIREMRALRSRLAESIRGAAATHMALLDTLEADPADGDAVAIAQGLENTEASMLDPTPASVEAEAAAVSTEDEQAAAPAEYVEDASPAWQATPLATLPTA